MYSPASTDYSYFSLTPRSSYATADSPHGWSDTQSYRSATSSSHRSSFLDMSEHHPVQSNPEARSQTRIYTPIPGPARLPQMSAPDTPTPHPCERLRLPESYTLSPEQLAQLVAAVQQASASSQSSPGRPGSTARDALQEAFEFVRGEVLSAVVSHSLEEDEIHKLSSDPGRNRGRVSFDRYGRGFDAQGTSIEDYPTLQSLLDPLATYFRILLASCANVNDLQCLADGSHQYIARLSAFADKYEWPAVLAYHFDFHHMLLREMRTGEYGGWGAVDVGLHARYLAGREKGWSSRAAVSSSRRIQYHPDFARGDEGRGDSDVIYSTGSRGSL